MILTPFPAIPLLALWSANVIQYICHGELKHYTTIWPCWHAYISCQWWWVPHHYWKVLVELGLLLEYFAFEFDKPHWRSLEDIMAGLVAWASKAAYSAFPSSVSGGWSGAISPCVIVPSLLLLMQMSWRLPVRKSEALILWRRGWWRQKRQADWLDWLQRFFGCFSKITILLARVTLSHLVCASEDGQYHKPLVSLG